MNTHIYELKELRPMTRGDIASAIGESQLLNRARQCDKLS
jgi:hypothetical protein